MPDVVPLIDRSFCCCFTGHRPAKLPWRYNESDERCLHLKEKIYDIAEAVHASGIRHYLCGMAQGCDLYFGEAVVRLRESCPDVTLEAVVPCLGQSAAFPEDIRRRYNALLDRSDVHTLLQREYTSDCMLRRNKYMVDHASVLIAVYSGAPGGTMHTLNYARKKGLETIEIVL